MSLQFEDKPVVWDHAKSFTEVLTADMRHPSLVHHCFHTIIEGNQMGQVRFFPRQNGLKSEITETMAHPADRYRL